MIAPIRFRAGPAPKTAVPRAPKGPVRSARRRAREFAMQGLYQWLVSHEDAGAIEAHLRESPGFERCDDGHFVDLLHGALGAVDELHAAIAPHLDRRLEELSPVEHATLLVGTFELARHHEIPYSGWSQIRRGGRTCQGVRRHGRIQVRQRGTRSRRCRPAPERSAVAVAAVSQPSRDVAGRPAGELREFELIDRFFDRGPRPPGGARHRRRLRADLAGPGM